VTFCYGSGSADPWHFATDLDLRIRSADVRIRIRILFFSSGSFKMSTKNCFSLHFHYFFKDKKSYRSHKTVEIKVFLLFLLDDGRIRIQEFQKHTYGSYEFGSESTTRLSAICPSDFHCQVYASHMASLLVRWDGISSTIFWRIKQDILLIVCLAFQVSLKCTWIWCTTLERKLDQVIK
jgi:hypothetical protein